LRLRPGRKRLYQLPLWFYIYINRMLHQFETQELDLT
jgi:hypothetical protein